MLQQYSSRMGYQYVYAYTVAANSSRNYRFIISNRPSSAPFPYGPDHIHSNIAHLLMLRQMAYQFRNLGYFQYNEVSVVNNRQVWVLRRIYTYEVDPV